MVANSRILYLLFLFIIVNPKINSGQTKTPALERTVSINVANETMETVLDQVSKQGHFSFSFNPAIMDLKKVVTVKMKDKSVREVLEHLLSPGVKYKMRGEHIILTKAPVSEKTSAPSYYLISGYVTDGNNGNKIPEVSIYDKETRSSSVTNHYGYYELKVDRKTNSVQLIVNKQQFKDTLIYVKQSGNTIINVTIYPAEKLPEPVDSSGIKLEQVTEDQLAFIDFMLSEEQKANTRNVKDTLNKKFQLAFLPFIGSNLRLSGNTVNDYSLNVLAGYSMGTKKLEVAGLINIDRDSVQSLQIAGLINATGGPVNGVQLGGLINANMKTTKGIQLAGLLNCNGDTVRGFQAAGLLNVNLGEVHGVNAAGLLNASFGNIEGVQVAGLLNFSLKEIEGAQVAGLLNVAAKDISGTQISGLVNYASKVKGSQLAFLNISDSSSGIPVGFLSFSRKGYHTIEINADEVFQVNLAFRTGVRRFYNIFTSGIQTKNLENPLWHYGYGLGTAVNLGKKWWLNFDLTAQQLLKGGTFEELNLLSKFNVTLDKSLAKKFTVAFGPTFNFYASNTTVPYYKSDFSKLPPYTFSNESYSNDLNIKMWVGGKVALRFL
ncbi:MAG: STN and carboxypeptidase regulatory-like domain-containing protein [Bacteroidota bacterium]